MTIFYDAPLRIKAPMTVVIIMAIVMGIDFFWYFHQEKEAMHQVYHQELTTALKQVESQITQASNFSGAQAEMLAAMPSIQRAFAKHDREYLKNELKSSFEKLKKSYKLDLLHLHLPPATSFLRAHKPELFGDDLSATRTMIVAANKFKTTQIGLEMGRAGLGVRGVVPVFYNKEHIGSLEFGYNTQLILNEVKKILDVDLGIYVDEKLINIVNLLEKNTSRNYYIPGYEYIGSTDGAFIHKVASSSDVPSDLEPSFSMVFIGGIEYGKATFPLIDYSEEKIGLVFVVKRFEAIEIAFRNRMIWKCASLLLQLIILAGVAITIFNGMVISPLRHLIQQCDSLSKEKTNALEAFEERKDEIGTLAHKISLLLHQNMQEKDKET